MKKIILHIGRHKTGTSSLQRFLVENRDVLEKHGYYYPRSAIKGYGHHEIAQPLSKREMLRKKLDEVVTQPQFAAFFEEIEDAIGERDVIVSSEAFQNCAPSLIAQLFSDYDVEVHVYLREQAGYLVSSYAQSIQATANQMTLADYEKNIFFAHYDRFIRNWCNAFQDSVVKVYLFDRSYLTNGDIIQDFLKRALCLDEAVWQCFRPSEEDQNPSLGGQLVEFKRRLNVIGLADSDADRRIYFALRNMAMMDKYQDKIAISRYTYDQLVSKYSEGNRSVSTRYFGTQDALMIKAPSSFADSDMPVLDEECLEEMVMDFLQLVPELEGDVSLRKLQDNARCFASPRWQWLSVIVKKLLLRR